MSREFVVSFLVTFAVGLILIFLLSGCTQSKAKQVEMLDESGSRSSVLQRSYDPETGVYCYQHKMKYTLSCVKVHEVVK